MQGHNQLYAHISLSLSVVTIGGIELANKIRKVQFDTSTIEQTGARVQQIQEAVLAA